MKKPKYTNEEAVSCNQFGNVIFALGIISLVLCALAGFLNESLPLFLIIGVASFAACYGVSVFFSAVASITQRVNDIASQQK